MKFEFAQSDRLLIAVPAGVCKQFGDLLVYIPAEQHSDDRERDEWGEWFTKHCSACGEAFTADNPCCCDAGLSPSFDRHKDGFCYRCCPTSELHKSYLSLP